MGQRPKAPGFASLLALLAAFNVGAAAEASSGSRQGRRRGRDGLAACLGAGGHPRACRKSVLGRCKIEGVAACKGQADGAGRPDGVNLGRGRKSTTTTTTTTTRPPTTTTTATTSATTTTLAGAGARASGLHYAANHNFPSSGGYAPAQAGFNLADLSGVSTLNALPSGAKGLGWLGLCNGSDATFSNAVKPFSGNPKLFRFYLLHEPDPTRQWDPLCPAANLLAESDWIHANDPGAKTF